MLRWDPCTHCGPDARTDTNSNAVSNSHTKPDSYTNSDSNAHWRNCGISRGRRGSAPVLRRVMTISSHCAAPLSNLAGERYPSA
jgi:hypothetical protein